MYVSLYVDVYSTNFYVYVIYTAVMSICIYVCV